MTTSLYTRRGGRALSAVPGAVSPTEGAADWRDAALCRRAPDRETFFPVGANTLAREEEEQAKIFCGRCPVRMTCAQWAIATGQEGVWGGLNDSERASIRRHTTAEATAAETQELIRKAWSSTTENPLVDAYLNRTEQDDDGHVRWLISSTSVSVRGRVLTPPQLAFEIGHRRLPEGAVKATCGRPHCVAPEHLADGVMRQQRTKPRQRAAA